MIRICVVKDVTTTKQIVIAVDNYNLILGIKRGPNIAGEWFAQRFEHLRTGFVDFEINIDECVNVIGQSLCKLLNKPHGPFKTLKELDNFFQPSKRAGRSSADLQLTRDLKVVLGESEEGDEDNDE